MDRNGSVNPKGAALHGPARHAIRPVRSKLVSLLFFAAIIAGGATFWLYSAHIVGAVQEENGAHHWLQGVWYGTRAPEAIYPWEEIYVAHVDPDGYVHGLICVAEFLMPMTRRVPIRCAQTRTA